MNHEALLTIRRAGLAILLLERRLIESPDIADGAYILQTGPLMLRAEQLRPARILPFEKRSGHLDVRFARPAIQGDAHA